MSIIDSPKQGRTTALVGAVKFALKWGDLYVTILDMSGFISLN